MPVRPAASHRALVLGQGPEEVSITGMVDPDRCWCRSEMLATMPIK